MTDSESRIQTLEQTVHNIDKRQESFEMFMRAYIEGNEKRLERMDAKFDKMDAKMDRMIEKIDGLVKYVQSLTITAMVGMLGIAGSVVYFVYSVTPKP